MTNDTNDGWELVKAVASVGLFTLGAKIVIDIMNSSSPHDDAQQNIEKEQPLAQKKQTQARNSQQRQANASKNSQSLQVSRELQRQREEAERERQKEDARQSEIHQYLRHQDDLRYGS